jgi:hypothetical protein
MAENTSVPEPRGLFGSLMKLFGRSQGTPVNKGEVTRTSEIRSSDGPGVVGDSMRKMDIMEQAKEEGRLINDGDAPQFEKSPRKK